MSIRWLAGMSLGTASLVGQAPLPPTIDGRVLDVLGDPITAASVHVVAGGRIVASTAADGEGIYSVRLPATGGEIAVQAPGKVATRILVRGAAAPRVRNFVLEDGGTLRGTVRDEAGLPVPHAMVIAATPGIGSQTTLADDRGVYTFTSLPLRRLMLRACDATREGTAELPLRADATHDLQLTPADLTSCRVHIDNLPGTAIADAIVRVFGTDLLALQKGGRLALEPDGTALVQLHSSCVIQVLHDRLAVTPQALVVAPGAREARFTVLGPAQAPVATVVTGKLRTDTGHPIGNVLLCAQDRNRQELAAVVVDADGLFRMPIAGAKDLLFRFGIALGDWILADRQAAIADGFSWVPCGDVDHPIDLVAERTGRVQTTVCGPDGKQFALAEVVIVSDAQPHLELVRTFTNRNGRFTVGLPGGRYQLLAIAHDGSVCRAQLQVVPGQEHAVQWQAIATSEVRGVLTDAAGAPIPGAELHLSSTELLSTEAVNASERQRCRVLTDRQGRFRCLGVPAGSWFVGAVADPKVASTEVAVVAGRPLTVALSYGP